MEYRFADRISKVSPSAIRELFKFTQDPEVISFAAGSPSQEAFPVEELKEIANEIFSEMPYGVLKYGVSEGYEPLRQQIKDAMKAEKTFREEADNLFITSGAQQVMDLLTKTICNEHDVVLSEEPAFVGSLNTFKTYNVDLVGVKVGADGMDIDDLEAKLEKYGDRVKFIYTIPNFQNPMGFTMPIEKRKALYDLAKKYQVIVLEDNPYGKLRTSGEEVANIKTFDDEGLVVYAGTFSKILAPGIRVGYVIGPEKLIAKMIVGKQATDVHTSLFAQVLASKFIERTNMPEYFKSLQAIYRKKVDFMSEQIDKYLLDYVTYNKPEGGLFIWCQLKDGIDMQAFCKKALENKVAVVPGSSFMIDGQNINSFRLNFSNPSDEDIVKGMQLLAKTAESMIK
ncbi:MAG: PLP-dependent aminotransferase family protein [Clostridia bacterium]|nr:PLP-dependent aminotransferase family protein [Clostridia bacterium]